MIDLFKKTLYTGFGMASLTRDAASDLARTMTDQLKLSKEEGEKLVSEMMEKSETAKDDLKNNIQSTCREFLSKADISSQKEVEALKVEIEALKKRCQDLEQNHSS
jgi:polyhydroxyalkanoate synthesis regulator phasin